MPVTIICPLCHAALRVPTKLVGQNFKCPKCSGLVSQKQQTNDFDFSITGAPTPAVQPIPQAKDRIFDEGQEPQPAIKWFAITAITLSCIALPIIIAAVANRDSQPLKVAAWISGFCAVMAIGGYTAGQEMKCPKCNWWWARVPNGKRLVDKKLAYKQVTRRDHYSGSSVGVGSYGVTVGSSSGTRSRTEQIKVMRHTYEHLAKCKKCGHEWVLKQTTEDHEDFVVGE